MAPDDDNLTDTVPAIPAHFRLQWEEAQAAWVMLYPEGMVKLSATAGEIMRRCGHGHSVNHLIGELEALYGAPQIRADVLAFLKIAKEQGWLSFTPAAAGGAT